jgi:hypothetical protein
MSATPTVTGTSVRRARHHQPGFVVEGAPVRQAGQHVGQGLVLQLFEQFPVLCFQQAAWAQVFHEGAEVAYAIGFPQVERLHLDRHDLAAAPGDGKVAHPAQHRRRAIGADIVGQEAVVQLAQFGVDQQIQGLADQLFLAVARQLRHRGVEVADLAAGIDNQDSVEGFFDQCGEGGNGE